MEAGELDLLRDGVGEVVLFWDSFGTTANRIIENFVPPSGTIDSAQIVIDAIPVPEPGTGMLLMLGLVMASIRLPIGRGASGRISGFRRSRSK